MWNFRGKSWKPKPGVEQSIWNPRQVTKMKSNSTMSLFKTQGTASFLLTMDMDTIWLKRRVCFWLIGLQVWTWWLLGIGRLCSLQYWRRSWNSPGADVVRRWSRRCKPEKTIIKGNMRDIKQQEQRQTLQSQILTSHSGYTRAWQQAFKKKSFRIFLYPLSLPTAVPRLTTEFSTEIQRE